MILHRIPSEQSYPALNDTQKLCALNYSGRLMVRVLDGKSILYYWSTTAFEWRIFPSESIRSHALTSMRRGRSASEFNFEARISSVERL